MIGGRQSVGWTTLFYAHNFFQKHRVTERLYLPENNFISLLQLLNNNKLGNWQRLFCAQNLRTLQPVEKIKLGTRDVSFLFSIIATYNKVGNSIDELYIQETIIPSDLQRRRNGTDILSSQSTCI
jgi:hypothetical protein